MKKYLFLALLSLFIVVIIIVPKDFVPKSDDIDYSLIENEEKIDVYFVRDKEIIGIPLLKKQEDKFEMIFDVYKYLTEKSNAVYLEYRTCLNLNSKLLTYEIIGDDIHLNVTENFLDVKEEDLTFFYAQIYYSYKELGFKEVYIKINGQNI